MTDKLTKSSDYGLANQHLGYEAERFPVTAFIDNLFDPRGWAFSNSLSNEFQHIIILQSRTYGIQVSSKFSRIFEKKKTIKRAGATFKVLPFLVGAKVWLTPMIGKKHIPSLSSGNYR